MWFQRLYGDTDSFAIQLTFEPDPHPAAGMDAALRASWGTLALWADGRCLTRCEVGEDGLVEGPKWYLLPVLKWLARSAVALLNEEPFPGLTRAEDIASAAEWLEASEQPLASLTEDEDDEWFLARDDWRRRHAVRVGFEGAVVPNILLRRLGDEVEVSWDSESRPSTRPDIRFLEPFGRVLVPLPAVESVLVGLLRDASDQLDARLEAASGLGTDLEALRLDEDAWEYLVPRRAGELAKQDPTLRREIAEPQRARCRSMDAESIVLPHDATTRLLRTLSPGTPGGVKHLLRLAEEAKGGSWSEALSRCRSPTPPPTRRPWLAGYDAALAFRDGMGLDGEPITDLGRWLSTQGVKVARQRIEQPVDGAAVVVGDGTRPLVHANPGGHRAKGWKSQMMLATGLGWLVLDAPRDRDFGVLHGSRWEPWASGARARAFAAMLLMPEDLLRREIDARGGTVDASAIEHLMQRCGTGDAATTWHLRNLGFISDDERLDLLRSLDHDSTRPAG